MHEAALRGTRAADAFEGEAQSVARTDADAGVALACFLAAVARMRGGTRSARGV
jgi:hypothetical protein